MIRKAAKEDVICIAEMASMMWDSHLEELIAEFGAVLDDEECAIYLYCTGNMPIGFAQCGLRHDYVEGAESSPVGYLEGIFIQEAVKMGCSQMNIGIVEENVKLRKWYEAHGVERTGTEKYDFFPFICGYMTKML